MNAGGKKEVLYEGVNVGEKDYSAIVSKIKASGADYRDVGRPAHRRRPDHPPDARPGHEDGHDLRRRHHRQRVRPIGGPGVEGTLMSFGPEPRNNPDAKDGRRGVQGQGLRSRRLHALFLCRDADHQAAAEAAKSLDPQKIADVMHSGMAFKTVIGDISYDAKGDRTTRRLCLVRLVEGRGRQDHLSSAVVIAESPFGLASEILEARRKRRASFFASGNLLPLREKDISPTPQPRKGLDQPEGDALQPAGQEHHAGEHQQRADRLLSRANWLRKRRAKPRNRSIASAATTKGTPRPKA